MQYTTLCYPERDNEYLMLHRVKKENDMNQINKKVIAETIEYSKKVLREVA